ncbi:hypothetical protein DLD82_04760 [Methanospirillum stamsii]|uniref:Uncharacterized protein n=1 Tax=Methanospirillum stamsii TaxID=1277351 RepID=A0A2V2NA29_9EURY|nr:hypothetical protein DLD82_04760 [Methanospirillum stamsii]
MVMKFLHVRYDVFIAKAGDEKKGFNREDSPVFTASGLQGKKKNPKQKSVFHSHRYLLAFLIRMNI